MAQLPARGEALEIPGDVFADVAAAAQFVVIEVTEVLGVTPQGGRDLAQAGLHPSRGPGESRGKVGEQPGPAPAPSWSASAT